MQIVLRRVENYYSSEVESERTQGFQGLEKKGKIDIGL